MTIEQTTPDDFSATDSRAWISLDRAINSLARADSKNPSEVLYCAYAQYLTNNMTSNHDPQLSKKPLDKLRFLICFECPKCDALLDYATSSYCEAGERVLFCKCGWQRQMPLVSRFVNYDPERGRFTCKWGQMKKTRAIRLTDEAWDNLEEIASSYGVNRADLLESWARSLREDDVTAFALEQQLKPRIGDMVLSPSNFNNSVHMHSKGE